MATRFWQQVLAAFALAVGTLLCVEGVLCLRRDETSSGALEPVAGVNLLQRKLFLQKMDSDHLLPISGSSDHTVSHQGGRLTAIDALAASSSGNASQSFVSQSHHHGSQPTSPGSPQFAGLQNLENTFAAALGSDVPAAAENDAAAGGPGYTLYRVVVQLAFGVLYYLLIASKYPALPEGTEPTEGAQKFMRKGEIGATLEASSANCCHAFCCSAPRAAQTFNSAGILSYWLGLFSMTVLPCCTLWAVNYGTDLQERLGGKKKDICMTGICACCCSCCVITQEAEALDLMTGAESHLCGVDVPEQAVPEQAALP